MKTWLSILSIGLLFSSISYASPSFYNESQRILNLYCVQCHNKSNIELTQGQGFGGFSLENLSKLPLKRDEKTLIKPGKPEESLLYRVLVVEVNNSENIKAMPLAGQRLSAKEIDVIKNWIETGAETPEPSESAFHKLSFEDEIQPIFETHCISCHNPKSKGVNGGDLDLTNAIGVNKGGRSGKVLKKGKPYESMLYLATALRAEERFAMPPADRYARLSLDQISKIRQWISEGANWPKDLVLGTKKPKQDLPLDSIDEEEMELVKAIHQIISATKTNLTDKTYQETLPSGINFDMALIPSGEVTLTGSEKNDVVQAKVSSFWMGTKEVTWDEYEPFMLSELPRERTGKLLEFMRDQVDDQVEFIARPTAPYHTMSFGMEKDGHPALSMTQHAANKYCQWLSYQTGHFYRLPTEAEWEHAYGDKNKTNHYWKGGEAKASSFAKFGGDVNAHYGAVGKLTPNKYGLHDMAGNVAEWTLDQFIENRHSLLGSTTIDPWIRATTPYPHVVKGGHYKSDYSEILKASRVPSLPKWKISDPQVPKSVWYMTDYPYIGFRVLRPVETPTAEEMYFYWNSGVEYDD